jgi:hypothetical protein
LFVEDIHTKNEQINVREHRTSNQSNIGNPEKLAAHSTQDEDKQSKNNPEKLTAHSTQDEDKQSKNTTQYVFDITIYTNKHKYHK